MAKTKATPAPTLSLSSFAAQEPAKKAARDKKDTIMAPAAVAKMIDVYQDAKTKIEELTARMKTAEEVIKGHGKKTFVEIVEKGREFESLVLASPTTGLLYIVQDRFKQVTADTAEAVAEVVGEKHIKATTAYTLNPELVEKYQTEIAKALQAMNIPAEDKANILLPKTTYAYDFGLSEIGRIAKENGVSVERIFDAVGPVQQLKSRGK